MPEHAQEHQIAAVRRFNRFYTRSIGVLREGFLESPFSLTEGRVLYELAQRERPSASDVAQELGLDAGYLSRILRGFQRRGLLERRPAQHDGRRSLLALTRRGRDAFQLLNSRSSDEVRALLGRLAATDQRRLLGAMATIEALLSPRAEPRAPYLLRSHQPGDMGWVVERHAALYAEERGYNEEFEALAAEIVARFLRRFDAKRERCWIAERDGENVGCVFLVKRSKTLSQLRLLLVEPKARGLGIGERLVRECIRFARQVGYRRMRLWTQDDLLPARAIYKKAGFEVIAREPHRSFGHDLVAETWELQL
jgi:DNA-binding MarR family transcriptional regulator/N-acetylglutamate synthase-like GNAT family acetyltransferase